MYRPVGADPSIDTANRSIPWARQNSSSIRPAASSPTRVINLASAPIRAAITTAFAGVAAEAAPERLGGEAGTEPNLEQTFAERSDRTARTFRTRKEQLSLHAPSARSDQPVSLEQAVRVVVLLGVRPW